MESSSQYTGYTECQIRGLYACGLGAALCSFTMGTLGIVLWLRMEPSRRLVFRLQLFLTLIVWDYIKAVMVIIVSVKRIARLRYNEALRGDVQTQTLAFCDGIGFIEQTVVFYSDFIVFLITTQNALMIFKPKTVKRYSRRIFRYHIIIQNFVSCLCLKYGIKESLRLFFSSWLIFGDSPQTAIIYEGGIYPFRWFLVFYLPLGILLSGLVFIDDGHYQPNSFCNVPQEPKWKAIISDFAMKYLNVISIVLVYTSIMLYLHFSLSKIARDQRTVYEDTQRPIDGPDVQTNNFNAFTNSLQREIMDITRVNQAKRRAAAYRELKTFAIYPIGYLFVWLTPIVTQIWYYVQPENKPYTLYLFNALIPPMSCTVNTAIFLVRERPWNLTTGKCKRSRARYPNGTAMDPGGNFGFFDEEQIPSFVQLDQQYSHQQHHHHEHHHHDNFHSSQSTENLSGDGVPNTINRSSSHKSAQDGGHHHIAHPSTAGSKTLVSYSRQSSKNRIQPSFTNATSEHGGGRPPLNNVDDGDDDDDDQSTNSSKPEQYHDAINDSTPNMLRSGSRQPSTASFNKNNNNITTNNDNEKSFDLLDFLRETSPS